MAIGLLFSGQGAQKVGMGADLYENSELARNLYATANEILGWDLAKVSFDGPEELLMETNICQPALFVCGYAIHSILRESGSIDQIDVVMGLSLGELTAHAVAGTFDFSDGLKIVAERARLMQMACEITDGTMASLIGGNKSSILELCDKFDVEIANYNSPEQTVISGGVKQIGAAVEAAKNGDFRMVLPLKVGGAYHSRLMEPARKEFETFLADFTFSNPSIKVLSNITGSEVRSVNEIKRSLIDQIVSPVRWIDCMRYAAAQGVTEFYECGPGKVLTGLARRIDRTWNVSSQCEFSGMTS